MSFEFEVKCKCSRCEKTLDEYSACIHCEHCLEEVDNEWLLDSAKHISEEHQSWKDEGFFQGFNSEEEKQSFLQGVKYGCHDALFWLCHYAGDTKFYEKNIHPNFEFKPEEEHEHGR